MVYLLYFKNYYVFKLPNVSLLRNMVLYVQNRIFHVKSLELIKFF